MSRAVPGQSGQGLARQAAASSQAQSDGASSALTSKKELGEVRHSISLLALSL